MRSDEDKKLISICVPLFNEGIMLPLYERLADVAKSIKGHYNIEFMFSDNHSDDGTWERLCVRAERFA